MSTALAPISTGNYLALQEGGAIAEAIAANMGEGVALRESDLTRVPIPSGGGTTWMIPDINGERPAKSIEGILIVQCTRGVLWASEEPQEGSLPLLVSHDLKTARLVNPDADKRLIESIAPALLSEGVYDWVKLPQNQWGTGKGGNGKAAKEQRVLYILTADDPLPLVIVVQPGSLKNWREFILALSKAAIPHYRAVISLTLEKDTSTNGQPYSKVLPKLVGTLDVEQGNMILQKFTTPMRGVAQDAFAG